MQPSDSYRGGKAGRNPCAHHMSGEHRAIAAVSPPNRVARNPLPARGDDADGVASVEIARPSRDVGYRDRARRRSMRRTYRVAATAAATAGLLTGAGVALAAVSAPPRPPSPSRPAPVADPSASARRAELARLQAELGSAGNRGAALRAQIARLQRDIARASAAAPSTPPGGP